MVYFVIPFVGATATAGLTFAVATVFNQSENAAYASFAPANTRGSQAYPWPPNPLSRIERPKPTTTPGLAVGAIMGLASYRFNSQIVFRHLRAALRAQLRSDEIVKIKKLEEFLRNVGPGAVSGYLNACCAAGVAGAAKAYTDVSFGKQL
mmetsp:Transcript_19794/g.64343  ORF Transcript_19794/g.64343 Transcript_19794/m.64343 type:complete len:150 (-) Transcript_19794:43-492(-)